MKITRVLNTNSVLSKDAGGNEIVLLGVGLGFKHKIGDHVDEDKIEKQFVLKDKAQQFRFQELVNKIPPDYIMVAEQIISLGKLHYTMKLSESIHISLADHIHTAVINKKNGIQIPNSLLLDIKHYYADEYRIALEGLDLIKEKLGCALPDDEAGFIAMHFVNALYGSENTNIKKMLQFVSQINELILNDLGVSPDENSLNYYRYMTHLKFFAQRVITNLHYDEEDTIILDTILSKFQKEYSCSKKVCEYIKEKYNYKATNNEILYLAVHLTHLTK